MVTYHLKEKKNSFFHFFPTKVKKLFSFVNFIILFFIFFYRPLLQPSFFFFFLQERNNLFAYQCTDFYSPTLFLVPSYSNPKNKKYN